MPLIVADVFELAARFREQGDSIAATVSQTQARWQVMSAASSDPLTVSQIARRLGVSRQNVQRIADALTADGSAQFQPNPDHQNSPHLVLTAQGVAALRSINRAAHGHHARAARVIGAKRIADLHRALRDLLAVTDDAIST